MGQKNYKPAKTVDRYMGKQFQLQRQQRDISIVEACELIDISQHQLRLRERGRERIPASDIFQFKKTHDFNIDAFFTHDGEYYSDVILDQFEMADVFHYFSNIEDPKMRGKILDLMKEASSVF